MVSFFILLALFCSSAVAIYYDAVALSTSNRQSKRLAFGSCFSFSNLDKDVAANPTRKSIFTSISELAPSAFLWMGDLSYISGDNVHGYDRIKNYAPFVSLKSSTPTYGVWDDHDYGLNDAGKYLPGKRDRLQHFLDLFDVPASDIDRRERRSGAYNSVKVGNFLVIFLDTRYNRENHFLPSVGGWKHLPFAAVIAAFTRWCVVGLGLGANYSGAVLGEEQWNWLEKMISEANNDESIDHTIVVSSIQVLTTNPIVESWGHFPIEKKRLLKALSSSATKSLLILSGDVHHADMFSSSTGGKLLEVTSSGMTHSCTEPFYGFICTMMNDAFPHGRHSSYSTSRNFGEVEEGEDGSLTVRIRDIEGEVLLESVGKVSSGVDIVISDGSEFHSFFLVWKLVVLAIVMGISLSMLLGR